MARSRYKRWLSACRQVAAFTLSVGFCLLLTGCIGPSLFGPSLFGGLGGKKSLQSSLEKEPPPEATVEATQRGWQFVEEQFPLGGEKIVVYLHRAMSAFSCQAVNVNKRKSQGKLRVIKKVVNRKEGWRVISLRGATSRDPTLVVCDENKYPPSAWGAAATDGRVAELGEGKAAPIPNAEDSSRGWKVVASQISTNYETRSRSVRNPYYDSKIPGSSLFETERYRVESGHNVIVDIYLFEPGSLSCIVNQQFKGGIIKSDSERLESSVGEMGWYQLLFVFSTYESGLYSYPVFCK